MLRVEPATMPVSVGNGMRKSALPTSSMESAETKAATGDANLIEELANAWHEEEQEERSKPNWKGIVQ